MNIVSYRDFRNIIFSELYVSHLSFSRQIETGINLNVLRDKYDKFYYTLLEGGRL
jgi:hypothetical protein